LVSLCVGTTHRFLHTQCSDVELTPTLSERRLDSRGRLLFNGQNSQYVIFSYSAKSNGTTPDWARLIYSPSGWLNIGRCWMFESAQIIPHAKTYTANKGHFDQAQTICSRRLAKRSFHQRRDACFTLNRLQTLSMPPLPPVRPIPVQNAPPLR
jgi:hypothetical protein